MKKFFAIAALAAMTLSANAQVWIGGELNVNSTKEKLTYESSSYENDAVTTFSIAPEIGYNLNDRWAVALKLAYTHNPSETVSIDDNTNYSGRSNTFAINPYVRYTFVKAGNFSAFIDGGFTYTNAHINGTSDYIENPQAFSIGFNPGIAYAVSDKVTLVAHIGDLSYATSSVKAKKYDIKYTRNQFNFGIDNGISFGAYVAL